MKTEIDPIIEVIEPKLFAGAVADELVRAISETVEDRGSCSVVLAGGSTPAAIYRALGTPPRVGEVPWDKVTLYLGDERWVPVNDNQSNKKMVETQLFSGLAEARPQLIGVDTSLKDPVAGASNYEKQILNGVARRTDSGQPIFDILLLGIGNDGHIASLFPGQSTLQIRSGVAIAANNPNDQTERVSLTMPALLAAERTYLLVTGAGKSEIMHRVLTTKDASLPAVQFLAERRGVTTCFLDSAAATSL